MEITEQEIPQLAVGHPLLLNKQNRIVLMQRGIAMENY